MVLMAGMLPGVEGARRRRLRPAGASTEAPPCVGARRPSLCLHAGAGNGHAHLASATGASKQTAWPWTKLDSNAREAKERLDHKLRSQRESVVKRHHSTGSLRAIPAASTTSGDVGKDTTAAAASVLQHLQREVFSKKGGERRFSWGGRTRRKASAPPELQQQAECAVCLEEFRAGEVLACLPCGHRFHWACAVPWVQASSRCPFCRAAVPLPLPAAAAAGPPLLPELP